MSNQIQIQDNQETTAGTAENRALTVSIAVFLSVGVMVSAIAFGYFNFTVNFFNVAYVVAWTAAISLLAAKIINHRIDVHNRK